MPSKNAVHESARRGSRSKLAWDKARTHELFRRYKEHGDEDAREQLIMNHLNLVHFLAAKFKNRGEPLDDLVQVGTVGLIKQSIALILRVVWNLPLMQRPPFLEKSSVISVTKAGVYAFPVVCRSSLQGKSGD